MVSFNDKNIISSLMIFAENHYITINSNINSIRMYSRDEWIFLGINETEYKISKFQNKNHILLSEIKVFYGQNVMKYNNVSASVLYEDIIILYKIINNIECPGEDYKRLGLMN